MRSERAEAVAIMQRAEKEASRPGVAKLALPAKFEEGKSSRALFCQPRKHGRLQFRAASLFERVGELQNPLLPEGGAINLQADGQSFGCFAARNGDARNARERSCNCINISKIHLQWVRSAFTQAERWNRRSGREDGVHIFEGFAKIARDERPNFLSLQIVCVVVARREDVCAEDDAALHLGAKSAAACLLIHFDQRRARNARTVTNAVVARKVRTGLGGGDDVIRRDGVVGIWHPDGHAAATKFLKQLNPRLDLPPNFGVNSFGEVVFRNANASAAQWTAQSCGVIGYRRGGGGGIPRITPGECGHHRGGIVNCAREWANAVKGRRVGD